MAWMFIPELLEREFMLSQVLGFMTYAAATNSDNPANLGRPSKVWTTGRGCFKAQQFLMETQEVDHTYPD